MHITVPHSSSQHTPLPSVVNEVEAKVLVNMIVMSLSNKYGLEGFAAYEFNGERPTTRILCT